MIYDINKKQVHNDTIVTKHCTYLFAKHKIAINVLEGDCKVFLATDTNVDNIQQSKTGFTSFNTGYTIFIPENNKSVVLGFVDSVGNKSIIKLTLRLEDILPEHYDNLITNYHLPTYAELVPATISNENELIKRLLLDFREILKYKGTKTGIEKFFYLLGYTDEQLTVTEEYKRLSKLSEEAGSTFEVISKRFEREEINYEYQTEDNPLVRTGDYYISIDSWKDLTNDNIQQLTPKNLPLRKLQNINYQDKLIHAIILAKIYFTAPEQDIVFFGISYSSNIELYQNTTSNTCIIYDSLIGLRESDIQIQIQANNLEYIVKNNIQEHIDITRSEYDYLIKNDKNALNADIHFIDRSIDGEDDFVGKYDINLVRKDFGALLYTDITLSDNVREAYIEIQSREIVFDKIKRKLTNKHDVGYLMSMIPGYYDIKITAFDFYGNKEEYHYEYNVIDNERSLIIDVLSSANMLPENEQNKLYLEIDWASRITDVQTFIDSTITKIIQESQDFSSLDTYYEYVSLSKSMYQKTTEQMHRQNKFYILPDLNPYVTVSDVTDTLPINCLHGWFEYILVPIFENDINVTINLNRFDYETFKDMNVLCSSFDDKTSEYTFGDLFIKRLDIKNDKSYLFIVTKKAGVNMVKELFDFEYHSTTYSGSIWDIPNTQVVRQQINYNIPLHLEDDTLVYQAEQDLMWIQSPFVRLNYSDKSLKIGDYVVIMPNAEAITKQYNVTWELYDAFTKKLLARTNDSVLKYRIENKTIYNLVYKMTIHDKSFTITKNSFLSSL